jgi:hypothetical protein
MGLAQFSLVPDARPDPVVAYAYGCNARLVGQYKFYDPVSSSATILLLCSCS